MSNALDVTDSDFETQIEQHKGLAVVDFWAAWCAPCRSLAPVVDALADKLDGALAVVKIDTDAEQALAGQFGVRSLPTLMLFRDGRAVGQLVGAQPWDHDDRS